MKRLVLPGIFLALASGCAIVTSEDTVKPTMKPVPQVAVPDTHVSPVPCKLSCCGACGHAWGLQP